MNQIISIDPGTKKCGFILADIEKNIVLDARIILRHSILDFLKENIHSYSIDSIIIGNGTNSRNLYSEIRSLDLSSIKFVDEIGTTLRARYRFWEINPPGCFLKFIPRSMLLPPEGIDAIAALVLLEDYLQRKLDWPKTVQLKIWP